MQLSNGENPTPPRSLYVVKLFFLAMVAEVCHGQLAPIYRGLGHAGARPREAEKKSK
jgi:hypothetical protein